MPRNGMLIRISLVLGVAAALATIAVTAAGAARTTNPVLNGAGSTFVQPLINTWTQLPSQANSPFTSAKNITVNYSGGGSGAGIAAITNKTVDFGASDAPLSAYSPTCDSCYQIPWALSGTAIIYRIDNLNARLKMSGPVLANIYLGNITYWDAAAIKHLNPGVSIPHTPITTVHRDSASGTTYNLTDYLSRVSADFKSQVGKSTFPQWPGSNTQQAHGSSGMDAAVKATNGAVGYVDVYYGVTANLEFMKIKNRAGNFEIPTIATIAAAAKIHPTPPSSGEISIVNPPSAMGYGKAYPIGTYTYVMVQKQSAQAAALKTFIHWAVTTGQTGGPSPGYAKSDIFVPLPSGIVTWDKARIKKITQS